MTAFTAVDRLFPGQLKEGALEDDHFRRSAEVNREDIFAFEFANTPTESFTDRNLRGSVDTYRS